LRVQTGRLLVPWSFLFCNSQERTFIPVVVTILPIIVSFRLNMRRRGHLHHSLHQPFHNNMTIKQQVKHHFLRLELKFIERRLSISIPLLLIPSTSLLLALFPNTRRRILRRGHHPAINTHRSTPWLHLIKNKD
jgi:hypothetical protein